MKIDHLLFEELSEEKQKQLDALRAELQKAKDAETAPSDDTSPKAEEPKAEEPTDNAPAVKTSVSLSEIDKTTKTLFKDLITSIEDGSNPICKTFDKFVALGNPTSIKSLATDELYARATQAKDTLYNEMQFALIKYANSKYNKDGGGSKPTTSAELEKFIKDIVDKTSQKR